MNFNILHSLMSSKGFNYFQGGSRVVNNTNDVGVKFSTLPNGKGDTIEVISTEFGNDIKCIVKGNTLEGEMLDDESTLKLIDKC